MESRKFSFVDLIQSIGLVGVMVILFQVNRASCVANAQDLDSLRDKVKDNESNIKMCQQEFNYKLDKILYIMEQKNPRVAEEYDKANHKVIWVMDTTGTPKPFIRDSLGNFMHAQIDSAGRVIPDQ